jgi:hypothetical protein
LPGFNLQKAQEYGSGLVRKMTNQSGEVTEQSMRTSLDEKNYDDPAYLHGVWFLAKLFTQKESTKIRAKEKEADEFQRSFKKTTPQERNDLTAFKRGQDPKYSAQSYQVAYSEWGVMRFKQLFKQ